VGEPEDSTRLFPQGSTCGSGTYAQPELAAGDAILFDYRLWHAGGANRTEERRPILYHIYARPWFDDTFNFAGSEETLAYP
jgi:ectoine hydroxylase-related dioxygenase (phytanoyl-CoA dioxygenase family)